jgi:hypothetical protein
MYVLMMFLNVKAKQNKQTHNEPCSCKHGVAHLSYIPEFNTKSRFTMGDRCDLQKPYQRLLFDLDGTFKTLSRSI